jgi:hypothetical protein
MCFVNKNLLINLLEMVKAMTQRQISTTKITKKAIIIITKNVLLIENV